MRSDELLDAVGGIDPEFVDAADRAQTKEKRPARRWIALAACLALVLLGGYTISRLNLFGAGAGGGGGDGLTYMSYAGPVFPLSAMEPAQGVTASRHINFDFASKGETDASRSAVTDGYTLTNSTGEEKTLTLLYPFCAGLHSASELRPILAVDGKTVETELHIGPYTGTFVGAWGDPRDSATLNLEGPSSWEGIRDVIDSGYQAQAFDPLPQLDQKVTVYELRDRYAEAQTEGFPTIRMSFSMDYSKTTILSYGFNGSTQYPERGYCEYLTYVPSATSPDYGQSAWLIVLGEDISGYKLTGYTNAAATTELPQIGATVIRRETTLGEMLSILTDQYFEEFPPDAGELLSAISREEFIGLTAELLCSYGPLSELPMDRYNDGMLEMVLSETRSLGRILYLTAEVTVPAGGSVQVTAEMIKPASRDFIGRQLDRRGYDLVTRLGSVLEFTEQSASLTNTEGIEILRQNFGFDLEKGVTEVALDPAEPHYYMDIRRSVSP